MIQILDKFQNNIDITFSRDLQSLSNNLLDNIFKIITQFGDIYAFMFFGLLMYIFIDKKHGYRYFLNMFTAGFLVSGLKLFFQRLRPFEQNIGIKTIGPKTHGYSFPSGHSQISTTISISYIHKFYTKFSIYILFISYIFLVALSRIYLGQHFLTDVLTGILISCLVYFFLHHLLNLGYKDYQIGFIFSLLFLGYSLFNGLYFNQFEKEYFQISAGSIFFTLGYYLEEKYLKYVEKSSFIIQILKMLIALLGVGLIYFSKKLLPYQDVYNLNNALLDLFRYGAIAFYVSFILPLLFKYLFKINYPYEYKEFKIDNNKVAKQERYYQEIKNRKSLNDKDIIKKENEKFLKYIKKY